MMKQFQKILALVFLTVTIFSNLRAISGPPNYLQLCWNKQVKPLQEKHLTFSYTENRNELEHSFEPWQQTNYNSTGIAWCNTDNFIKSDSLTFKGKRYNSKILFNKSTMLFLDYGDKDLFEVTQSMFIDQTYHTARYSPIILINYFIQNKIIEEKERNQDFAVYKTTINKVILKLFIRKSDYILDKVITLGYDELFGDILTTYTYSNYSYADKLLYPKTIQVEKINGKIIDKIEIQKADLIAEAPTLLDKPIDYKLKEEIEVKPEIKVEKHTPNISFIELKHTDDKVMVVEFGDFMLVAEAPLNSKNGDLIISEAKKIAPNKPIKYFVFGHYHPHYLGGIRPFIHKGAKIICSKNDLEYVTYIANASHSISPDSLHIQPKSLLIENIKDSLKITDGKFEIKIYFIGEKSKHTKDYLIYYFPSEKLLFQDDLVWISKDEEIEKASGRQAGLYHSIKELGLNVETIIQSWPVADHGVKTVIPFTDLEKSMNIK